MISPNPNTPEPMKYTILGDLHAAQWEKGGAEFEALGVSPFVLFRPV